MIEDFPLGKTVGKIKKKWGFDHQVKLNLPLTTPYYRIIGNFITIFILMSRADKNKCLKEAYLNYGESLPPILRKAREYMHICTGEKFKKDIWECFDIQKTIIEELYNDIQQKIKIDKIIKKYDDIIVYRGLRCTDSYLIDSTDFEKKPMLINELQIGNSYVLPCFTSTSILESVALDFINKKLYKNGEMNCQNNDVLKIIIPPSMFNKIPYIYFGTEINNISNFIFSTGDEFELLLNIGCELKLLSKKKVDNKTYKKYNFVSKPGPENVIVGDLHNMYDKVEKEIVIRSYTEYTFELIAHNENYVNYLFNDFQKFSDCLKSSQVVVSPKTVSKPVASSQPSSPKSVLKSVASPQPSSHKSVSKPVASPQPISPKSVSKPLVSKPLVSKTSSKSATSQNQPVLTGPKGGLYTVSIVNGKEVKKYISKLSKSTK